LADDQSQFRLLVFFRRLQLMLLLELGQPFACRQNARLEFRLVQQAVLVCINQSRNALFHLFDQFDQCVGLAARAGFRLLQTAFVLVANALRFGQQAAHIFPHAGVQNICANLLVPAQSLAAETVGVGTGAAVVGIRDAALRRGPARGLSVATVAATAADDQALQQVATAARADATTLAILFELCLDRLEKVFRNESRYIDEYLVIL
jgi:hypothetical protein